MYFKLVMDAIFRKVYNAINQTILFLNFIGIKIMAKLNDKDSELLKTLLTEYATLENLSDVQRVIISLNAIDKKTSDNLKSLRAMLKIERDRIANQQLIADTLATQNKLKADAQTNFTADFFNAIDNKKFIVGLDSEMSIKQLLQKLIDDKIVSNNIALKQYLKVSPDVDFGTLKSYSFGNTIADTLVNL